MERRGITEDSLIECALRSTLDELAQWTAQAGKVLVF
jgi:sulfur relay (sulfurtransferase) complex TusBCD TusD component (DsrE family)